MHTCKETHRQRGALIKRLDGSEGFLLCIKINPSKPRLNRDSAIYEWISSVGSSFRNLNLITHLFRPGPYTYCTATEEGKLGNAKAEKSNNNNNNSAEHEQSTDEHTLPYTSTLSPLPYLDTDNMYRQDHQILVASDFASFLYMTYKWPMLQFAVLFSLFLQHVLSMSCCYYTNFTCDLRIYVGIVGMRLEGLVHTYVYNSEMIYASSQISVYGQCTDHYHCTYSSSSIYVPYCTYQSIFYIHTYRYMCAFVYVCTYT